VCNGFVSESFSTHHRQQPVTDGTTIMIPAIQISSFEIYKQMLTREQLRKSHLKRVVLWREIAAFGLAFLAFSVYSLGSMLTARSIGLLEPRFLAPLKVGPSSMVYIFA
jgi:type II secretory pathway component PulL